MIAFLKETVQEFLDDNCTRMAASLAYFTVFALPPLFVILVTCLGLLYTATGSGGEEQARKKMDQQITAMVGPSASGEIREMLSNAGMSRDSNWIKWTLSIIGVLVGATGVVAALQDTLNEAWDVTPDPNAGGIMNFFMKRVFSLGMILGIGFILLVSTVLTTWLTSIIGVGAGILSQVVAFFLVTFLFAAMFKYLPDVQIAWRDVLVGAVVTALLFSLGKYGLSLFLSQGSYATQFSNGAASLAVLLAWVYYSAMILLFGAEFTQVWSRRSGRRLKPENGAVRVIKERRTLPPEA